MTLRYYYCYACEIQFQHDFGSNELKCLTCSSDFIEEITNTEGLEQTPISTTPQTNNDPFPRPQVPPRARSSSASDSNPTQRRRDPLANISALPGVSSNLEDWHSRRALSTALGDRLMGMNQSNLARPRQEHMIRMEIDPENHTPAQIMEMIQNEIGNITQLTGRQANGTNNGQTPIPALIGIGAGNGENSIFGSFNNLEDMITQMMSQVRNEGRNPANEELIASVKSFEMTQKQIDKLCKEGNSDCPICMAPWELPAIVKKLPDCTHIFHAECIDAWLRQNSNCPVCRAPVTLPSVNMEGGAAGNTAGPHVNLENDLMSRRLFDSVGEVVQGMSEVIERSTADSQTANSNDTNNNNNPNQNANPTTPNPRSSIFNLFNGFTNVINQLTSPRSNQSQQSNNPNNNDSNQNQTSSNQNESNNTSSNNTSNNPRVRRSRPRSPGPPSYFS